MDRRAFLTAAGTTATMALAGCLGNNSPDDDETAGPPVHPLGETASHRGVHVTFNKYHLANRYAVYRRSSDTTNQSFSEGDWEEPPTAGGIFLCANVTVEHQGAGRRQFPPVGDPGDPTQSGIYGTYNGEPLQFFFPSWTFRANNRDYQSYAGLITANEAGSRGVYPGVAFDAWIITEVPRALRPAQLVMTVAWGTQNNITHHKWYFGNQPPEIVPDDYQYDVPTRSLNKSRFNRTAPTETDS